MSEYFPDTFNPLESLTKISGGMGYLYAHAKDQKEVLKLRQIHDIFLDKLLKLSDPLLNHREANKKMMEKNE